MSDIKTQLVVLGSGPGGYSAAFRAADLGLKVTLVEKYSEIGGVCLNVGCIPSKAMLHIAKVINEARHLESLGIVKVGDMGINKDKIVDYKNGVISKLTTGLKGMAKARKVDIVQGYVLMAIGRKPNGKLIDAEKAGVKVDERGFIPADKQLRTNVPHIFAIGDVIGQPMLAHKAVPEGRTAAEVISGLNHSFDPLVIPSVAYTDPEVAWVGETETSAKAKGIKYEKGVFPWAASGRSLSIDRTEGMTKVLYDENHKIIGTSIVGTNAGELIAESALAIEMGCDAEDIALTVHPHPTLSESLMMATEVFEGTATDLPPQRKKK
ncbi:UNVERIFIED_CONTAM: hypothetical protein GTU68_044199 [Idotea baltica]|nr:hypothetical protein [Idotea baltica]